MITHFEFNGDRPTAEWIRLLDFLRENGRHNGKLLEIVGLVVSINRPRLLKKREIRDYTATMGKAYWERARVIYKSSKGLSWKPSYIGRINGSDSEFNQLEAIKRRLVLKPGSKALACTIQRPNDLKKAASMPAGIPCVTAIDFKFRRKKLYMVVLFRSQDTLNLFLPDLHFLHSIQREVLKHFASSRNDIHDAESGDLVFIITSANVSRATLNKIREHLK